MASRASGVDQEVFERFPTRGFPRACLPLRFAPRPGRGSPLAPPGPGRPWFDAPGDAFRAFPRRLVSCPTGFATAEAGRVPVRAGADGE